ncbi:MAG: DUF5711 family protein [Oscillospiraceae bacterium]|nr:DUF5711 family protein [Oscillospiraceae bacterium]
MSGEDNTNKKKRSFIRPIILLVVIAIVAIIVISLVSAYNSGTLHAPGIFSRGASEISVDEFNFDVGRERVFAHAEGFTAAVGTLGINVFDAAGNETFRDAFRMSRPTLGNSGNRFIAYDIGGTSVRVFNSSQLISSLEIEGSIVSASINQNGWFTIVTHEGGNNRGIVTTYNQNGTAVHWVSFGTGFVLSAELSQDNHNLAILNLAETGSRINFYHGIDTDKHEPDFIFDVYGGLIIDIIYLPDNDVLAISMDSLFLVENDGRGRMLYSFADKHLSGYAHDGDFVALHLNDYGVGNQGRLISFHVDGTNLGEITFNREIVSMSVSDRTLVVLKSDTVLFFNEEFEEFPVSADSISTAGASRILAVSEDVAIATSENSAVVVRREKEH